MSDVFKMFLFKLVNILLYLPKCVNSNVNSGIRQAHIDMVCSLAIDIDYVMCIEVIFIVISNQIKSNLFAQQLTLYRQNHIHLDVLKTYYIIILQKHGYIK